MTDEKDATEPAGGHWTWQFWVAVGLLLGFAALVAIMMTIAPGDETVWQRRVYVFGTVEAIVFAAVGWMFGREVHRVSAEAAARDAEHSKEEAADARNAASGALEKAADAESRAAVEQTRIRAIRAASEHLASDGDAGGDDAGPHDAGMSHDVRRRTNFVAFIDDLIDSPPPEP